MTTEVEKAVDAAENASPVTSMRRGLTDGEVPEWLRFPHLTTGYRYGGTHAQALGSLFFLHNETLNAWTMVAASVFSIAANAWALAHERPSPRDAAAFVALCLSALVHLPFAVGYHLFLPISPRVYNRWRRLDVSFIFVASVFLAFALSRFVLPPWATGAVVGVAAAVACAALLQLANLKEGQALNRSAQAGFVGGVVLVYTFPMLCLTVKDAVARTFTVGCLTTLTTFVSLFGGAWAYADCFPERLAHGRYDLVGNSHQIMHVGVAGAHVSEFFFVLDAYRRHTSCCRFEMAEDASVKTL